MSSGMFYFSGAGNSKAVASMIAKELSFDFCTRMADADTEVMNDLNVLGLVFPSYYGVPPAYLIHFIHDVLGSIEMNLEYLFIVITHGGGPMYTAAVTEMLLQDAGYVASYTGLVRMVDTYIPLFRVPEKEKQDRMNEKAFRKVQNIIEDIREQAIEVKTRWPLSRNAYRLFNSIHHLRYNKDKKFTVDERCTACGVCVEVCPVGNITLSDGKVEYHGACEQCFACYHHCPTHAIGRTRRPLHGYQYYRGPHNFQLPQGDQS